MNNAIRIPCREDLGLVVVGPATSEWPSLTTLAPHVGDVVVVLVETSRHPNRRASPPSLDTPHQVMRASPSTHDHLFLQDCQATYREGSPLAGESYEGPFTNRAMVADWAEIRNLGLHACRSRWRLVLDAGDVVEHPEHLLLACHLLEQHGGDAGLLRLRSQQFHEAKISLGSAGQRFEGPALPTLVSLLRPAVLGDCLEISSPTRPTTPSPDVFKILYANARKRRWQIDPADLLHMSRHAGPDLQSLRPVLLAAHPRKFSTPEHHSFFYVVQGELMEERGQVAGACRSYELALEIYPGWKTAIRLARARFTEQRWHDVVEAHHRAMAFRGHPHLLDDAPLSLDGSLTLTAAALHALGHSTPARNAARYLRNHHPTAPTVAKLCEMLRC